MPCIVYPYGIDRVSIPYTYLIYRPSKKRKTRPKPGVPKKEVVGSEFDLKTDESARRLFENQIPFL